MAKKIIQDVIKKREKKKEIEIISQEPQERKKSSWLKMFFWILVAAVVAFLASVALDYFSSVTVKIVPRQEFVNVDAQFTAKRGTNGNLNFEIVQLEREESKIFSATGVSKEGRKASGEVIVYNTSSIAQKLINQTRFEASNGKIYRIQSAITLPASGSMAVIIYADKVGADYNIGLSDFTLPGFKGDPRYKTIYGRSKTEMKGGSSGAVIIISEDDLNKARIFTKQKVESYLKENIFKQTQENYVAYKDALKIDFSDSDSNLSVGEIAKEFEFKEKGKAVGFLLNKNDLQTALAEKYDKTGDTNVINLDGLEFTLISSNTDNTEISFKLKGKARFVWNTDKNLLIKDLMAAKDRNYDAITKKYLSINSAEVIFKPSWWRFIPKNSSQIKVEINY